MAQAPAVTFTNAIDALTQATSAIFSKWTALLLTVDHQLGGDYGRVRQMLQATVELALSTNPKCKYDDLVDFFYDEFDRMDTDVEDDSPEQVASHVIRIRDALANGDYNPAAEAVQQLASTPTSHVSQSVTRSGHGDEADDDDDGGDDGGDGEVTNDSDGPCPGTQTQPVRNELIVDADGFTEVSRRGRHRWYLFEC